MTPHYYARWDDRFEVYYLAERNPDGTWPASEAYSPTLHHILDMAEANGALLEVDTHGYVDEYDFREMEEAA